MKRSSGILMYRVVEGDVLLLLVAHMGGPFWAKKDSGAWSIPKGELDGDEDLLAVAVREFEEELGSAPPAGTFLDLGELRQAGGKSVHVFALAGEFDADAIRSNTFELEWPRGSGRVATYPEVDRAAWLTARQARSKLVQSQVPFVDRLIERLAAGGLAVSEGADGTGPGTRGIG